MTEPSFSVRLVETLQWLQEADVLAARGVETKARHLLLDTIACAVGGFRYAEPRAFADGLDGASMCGNVRWPGLPHALNPSGAAAVFGMAACWHEACEGLARAHGRPGLHAVPIALALGLSREATLGEILEAVVWGYEIGGRAGEAMRIAPGLHVDGTWGLLASVSAAARLQRFDAAFIARVLAVAACQIPQSLYRPIASGDAARNTYVAHALLIAEPIVAAAAAGISAPLEALDEAAGQLGRERAGSAQVCAPPGEILLLQSYLKPFAAVRHVHYGAACALQRVAARGLASDGVRAITLGIYDEAITYCGNRDPRSPIKAQFSLSYGLAHALRTGTLGPEAYTDTALNDGEQRRLEALTEIVEDRTILGRGAWLEIEADRGRERYVVSEIAGDPQHPLDEATVRTKALSYMGAVIAEEDALAIVEAILHAPLHAVLSPSLTGAA